MRPIKRRTGKKFTMQRAAAVLLFCLAACAITSRAEAADNSEFVSQSVPDTMTCFRNYTVSVTMKNTGTTTWTQAGGYKLGSYNPYDNWNWGVTRALLSSTNSIAPGESVTFTFTVTAPGTPGTWNFQWQMLKEGTAWFGQASNNLAKTITTVTHDALFVSQSVPERMIIGQSQSVSVTMKNIGSNTWTKAALYKLGSQNPTDNLTWGLQRVELAAGDSIAFGQSKTFTFTIAFPTSKPIDRYFQWRMLQEGVTWFGDATPNRCISAPDVTASVGSDGTKTEDMNAASVVIDNFNDGGFLNIWGGETGAYFDAGSTYRCIMKNSASAPQEGAFCLKLDFDVTGTNVFNGYFSKLQAAGQLPHDISAYTALSFYVKGALGGEYFKVELKNNSTTQYWDAAPTQATHYYRNAAAVYITDFLDGGVTTGWSKVTIPLHNFANLDSLTAMNTFVLTFENSASIANGITAPKGTIYLDNIALDTTPLTAVRVDYFGDKWGPNALGGNMGTMFDKGGTCRTEFTPAHYVGNPNSLKMMYNVSASGAWAGVYMIFGGGITDKTVEFKDKGGWIAVGHDFSAFNSLKLDMKGGAVDNPKIVKVELEYGTDGKASRDLSGITNTWQFWDIGLTNFAGLDKTTIKQINFVFEEGKAGGVKAGDLYVDRIEFKK